jgi:CheY-like chemotaxis protein
MTRHRALIVEDDKPTAEDLADIVRALDCEPVVVDNKLDAVEVLKREMICFALLDLQIKIDRDSLRGNVVAGGSLVREVRRVYPDHAGTCYRLPILVVSGYAQDADSAVGVMKDGADDLIQKPFENRDVSERILHALERSGRSNHASCAAMSTRSETSSRALVIAFPGERERKRTRVVIGEKTVKLTDGMLWVWLQLVVAALAGKRVHKNDLGATDDQGFRGISELRKALEPALGEGVDIIGNDHNGNYWITEAIQLGDVDIEQLVSINDRRIARLAEQLRRDPKV